MHFFPNLIGLIGTVGLTSFADIHVSIHSVRHGLGTICAVHDLRSRETPPSYLVTDIGKPGVPTVSRADTQELHKIQHYVHSSTLRFIYLNKRFLVFDATRGPCIDSAPGYFVLNGACNEFYMPSFDQTESTVFLPECLNAPRQWIKGDRGQVSADDGSRPH